ncbi:hypothetical protein [Metallibacterium sp.]
MAAPKNWPRALHWLRLARANGLHTYELASLEAWQTQNREQVEATQVPPSSGCTSQGGPSQVTVANESPGDKRIVQVEIDGRPSPLFGVNDYLAPGQEMIFPVFPYANDPENYNVSLQGIYHWYTYHVVSCLPPDDDYLSVLDMQRRITLTLKTHVAASRAWLGGTFSGFLPRKSTSRSTLPSKLWFFWHNKSSSH